MEPAELCTLLKRVCVQLREHFTAVQIVATRHSEDPAHGDEHTERFAVGKGDWYSRTAAVREWLDQCDVRMALAEERSQSSEDGPD